MDADTPKATLTRSLDALLAELASRPGNPQDAALRLLGPLQGEAVAGGCSECAGCYQRVEPITAGAWRITVYHDLDCEFMRRRGR